MATFSSPTNGIDWPRCRDLNDLSIYIIWFFIRIGEVQFLFFNELLPFCEKYFSKKNILSQVPIFSGGGGGGEICQKSTQLSTL
jgi:hypothetical protein